MLDPNTYETMSIERREHGIALVTLDRPERLNAVNGVMHSELARFSRDFASDPELRVLILTGRGRAFCAGGDFSPDANVTAGGGANMWIEARQIVDHILECDKPIISAVNGPAMGLGATVALLADVVVAGPNARFADPHVKMGIGAGDGGQLIWPALIGVNRAKYYLMTGEHIDGRQAVEMGLANFYVEKADELMPRALGIAEQLAAGAPKAIAASKMAVNAYLRAVSSLVLPLSLRYEELTMYSDDHREAVKAFQEKRPPVFKGR